MLIKNLISELKLFNPNADITLTDSEDITTSYIFKDANGNEFSKQTTMQVFIEGTDECPSCIHNYLHEKYQIRWCEYYNCACKDVEECNQWGEWESG